MQLTHLQRAGLNLAGAGAMFGMVYGVSRAESINERAPVLRAVDVVGAGAVGAIVGESAWEVMRLRGGAAATPRWGAVLLGVAIASAPFIGANIGAAAFRDPS